MIATRNPETVVNGHIRAAARKTARIFANARRAMPHIAWQASADDDTPSGDDCPEHGPISVPPCDKC